MPKLPESELAHSARQGESSIVLLVLTWRRAAHEPLPKAGCGIGAEGIRSMPLFGQFSLG
jgi:hypothetical protein